MLIMFSVCVGDGGIVVSMVAFQAVDPGSIPGHRNIVLGFKKAVNIVRDEAAPS